MKTMLLTASAALAVLAAGSAGATIVMVDASTIQGANVLFNNGTQSGTTVLGHTQSNTNVVFTGTTAGGGNIIQADGGQARIEGALDTSTANPNDTLLLNSLDFHLAGGATFNNLEFNLFGGSATSATITLMDNLGTAFTFANQALGSGSNFFGFQGISGETIRDVVIALNGGGIDDVRQIRLDQTSAAIPEPTAWALLILGFGGIGALARKRRAQGVLLTTA